MTGAAPFRALRVTAATRGAGRSGKEAAIGVAGWVLHGDGPDPIQTSVRLGDPAVVAVADGTGGHPGGGVAARITAGRLSRRGTVAAADLAAAFERADWEIHAAATPSTRGMGCSAAAALVASDGTVVVAGLGDVRAYHCVDGYLVQLTEDDRLDGLPGTLTRWLGGIRRTEIRPRRSTLTVRPGDRLLLCTDGLYDAVAKETIVRSLDGDPERAARRLLDAAAADAGDVTVVLLDLLPDADREPEPAAGAPIPATVSTALDSVSRSGAGSPGHGEPGALR